ncbi:MAG TPA: SCP2 sterol-binding domain-containing protein [Moraxellaceae bacterium]
MMAGYDSHNGNNKNNNDRHLAQHLWLGAIETLINAFIDLDAPTRERIAELHGLVVRVKVLDPYLPFYLYFTREGIEVCDVAPGPARVRINARLFDLMRTLLGAAPQSASGRPRVRVWGEAESVATLEALLEDFNLRTRAQHWLREHLNMDALWQKIRNHDPSWLQDFLPLPSLMRETLGELRLLNQNLQGQQAEFERYRLESQAQRRRDIIFMLLAFLAMMGAISGNLNAADITSIGNERLLLLAMGVLLVLSRLRP